MKKSENKKGAMPLSIKLFLELLLNFNLNGHFTI